VIRSARMLLIPAAVLVLALSGCGRKGSLDLPPSASVAQPPPAAATEQQVGPDGRPVAPGTKKQLPIDWLLN
jgi:predicted small lipoprotein YifL